MRKKLVSNEIDLKRPCRTLLCWLLYYPLLSAQDMALILNRDVSRIYQHLGDLLEAELIEFLVPSLYGSSRLYFLSNEGISALATCLQTSPGELADFWHVNEQALLRLLPRVSTLIDLQHLIRGLFAYAPASQTHTGQRLAIRWHWMRDYHHCFQYRGKAFHAMADAALIWQALEPGKSADGEEWYSAFVLQDRGLDDTTLMRQRLERLLAYRESAERWPVYHRFPAVFILVPSLHRAEHWQRSMREVASSMRVDGLLGAITTLPNEHANTWLLPWQRLSENVRCHLQDILAPLPSTALPPGMLQHAELAQQTIAAVRSGQILLPQKRVPRLVEGNFAHRAKCLPSWKQTNTREEHESIALLSLMLDRHHLDLISILGNHPLLATNELTHLLNVQPESAQRYLRHLCHHGCLQTWEQPHMGSRWYLSERGLHLLAAMQHVSILRVGTYTEVGNKKVLLPQGLALLQRYSKHLAGIYGFMAALHQAADRERHQICWWEVGAMCERTYRFQGVFHHLRPDAEFVYQAQGRSLRAWLEWDGGTMSRRDLEIKMNAYEQYIRSREWAREGARTLPILFCVVPEKGQEERIAQAAVTQLSHTALIVRTTTIGLLDHYGPLAAIWQQALPQESEQPALSRKRLLD